MYLAGTTFFLLFAFAARGHAPMVRGFIWAIALWSALGMGAVYISKLIEGLEEFFYYRPFRLWPDDPADGWVLAIVIVALQSLALQMLVIHPSMHGVSYWP